MIAIARLYAYEGPHIFGPVPGVFLQARCDRDRSARVRAALKDGAQAIGLVIAHLEVEAATMGGGSILTARFSTDAPALGADLCRYIVAGIAAECAGDEAWDRDGSLFALRTRRHHEVLPVAALQLVAEARARGLPVFTRQDGLVQLGYGARGFSFDPAALPKGETAPPTLPWEALGDVPLVAVTGQSGRAAVVHQFAAELGASGMRVFAHADASFDEARALLAERQAEALVLGLTTDDILRRGLPFDRCALAAITDCAGARPADADTDDEWLRALGVPMLLSPQAARINLSDERLRPLIPYAPNGVVGL